MAELCTESCEIFIKKAALKQQRFTGAFYRILSPKFMNLDRPSFKIIPQCIQRTSFVTG